MHPASKKPIAYALGAAALFGVTTPIAKLLALPPFALAGLLYLGSGAGLLLIRIVRDRGWTPAGLARRDLKWVAGATLFGGMLAPVCLMIGLSRASAAAASLLLNLESLFTAVLAWFVFKEHAGARVILGMLMVFAGGLVLSGVLAGASGASAGAGWIALACLGWAVDNNCTRPISSRDALLVAAIKGTVAGSVNLATALAVGNAISSDGRVGAALILGLVGYGFSLVLFVLALRGLGAARTGAYFATAPFMGALVSLTFLHEVLTTTIFSGGVLMLIGVVLHLTEEHSHEHEHEAMTHTHSHVHDEHHRHEHDFPWPDDRPHSHKHHHVPLRHGHAHYPDIHHDHAH